MLSMVSAGFGMSTPDKPAKNAAPVAPSGNQLRVCAEIAFLAGLPHNHRRRARLSKSPVKKEERGCRNRNPNRLCLQC